MKLGGKTALSLDCFFGEEGKGLHELISSGRGDPLSYLLEREKEKERAEKIHRALAILSPRERAAIMGFMEGDTLHEVGRRMGKSHETVRKLKLKSISKLKVFFGVDSF